MKKTLLFPLSILTILMMAGCSVSGTSIEDTTTSTDESSEDVGEAYDYNESVTVTDPSDIEVSETTSEFELSTSDGTFTKSGSVYTITGAGTYSLTGKLTGQILIDAGDDD